MWLLNIGAEKYWNRVQAGIVDESENRLVNRVEEMNLLLCREQDVLILREQPDAYFLQTLREAGCQVPRILVPAQPDSLTPIAELVLQDEELLRQLAEVSASRDDVYFVPYAVTRLEEQIAERCGLNLTAASSAIHAAVNDKIFNREMAEKLGFPVCAGQICSTVQEIRDEYRRLTGEAPFFKKVIVKEPHGASGKGLYIVDSEEKLNSLVNRLARGARNHPGSKWLVEGWYEKEADVNYQIYIAPDGSVDVFSIKQQVLRDTVYIGSRMPAPLDESTVQAYKGYGEAIGAYLYGMGYIGVAGIDSIITDDHTIVPIIEINGRFTLSTYISFLEQVLGRKKLFSRYLKVISSHMLDYEGLCELLRGEGILYRPESGEGVLLYTAGSLPVRQDAGSGKYPGRLFALIVADDWETSERYSAQLEAIVDNLASSRSCETLHSI